jgi:hypothetical protein
MVEVGLHRDDGKDGGDRRFPWIEEVAAAVQVEGDRDLAIPSLGGDQDVGISGPAPAMVWHREVDFELPGGTGNRVGALLALPVLPGHDLGRRSALFREKALEVDLSFGVGRRVELGFDLGTEARIAEREGEPAGEALELAGIRGDVRCGRNCWLRWCRGW